MPVISSVFFVISLILAVVIGPQTRAWTWGPSLIALGIAVCAATPSIWKKSRQHANFGLLALGLAVASWFAWRTYQSPVKEFGEADLILLCGVVGSFICMLSIQGNLVAERILNWGMAILLLANIIVVWMQLNDRSFAPIFNSRAAGFPSGFYAHYNEAANYLIASSILMAAASLHGSHSLLTKLFFGILTLGGIAALYYTRSRGGILGGAIGFFVLAAATAMIGYRKKAKWFVPLMIVVPLICISVIGFIYKGWADSQTSRSKISGMVTGSGIEQMMDNNGRLYFLGVAASCVGLHPLAGGGSRSFSWESYKFSGAALQGDIITHIPEQVHNELLQTATDYGLIGVVSLLVMLIIFSISVTLRLLFLKPSNLLSFDDAWRAGGLAALAGMLVQSSFSFVFHLLPGGILLGIALGQMLRGTSGSDKLAQVIGSKIILSSAAVSCLIFLLPVGLKGSRVTQILWPTYFSKHPQTSTESKVDALAVALKIWPQATLYQDRAFAFQDASSRSDGAKSRKFAELALADYEAAARLNPFDPTPEINRANVLSQLQQDTDAEEAYDKAIILQGGMEPAFRAHYLLAMHLLKKGIRQFSNEYPTDSVKILEVASQQMEESAKEMHWVIPEMANSRVATQESLGAAREANGDYESAMKAYDFAATLQFGKRSHYRAGVLNGKMAAKAWSGRRSSEAMWYFTEAKRRIQLATEMPEGVAESKKIEYLTYLDGAITYLKGAKIEPKAPNP